VFYNSMEAQARVLGGGFIAGTQPATTTARSPSEAASA
jgi:hypothetical protein